MARDSFATSHDWELRRLSLSGVQFLHRRCRRCARDFATTADKIVWRAVHVGIFEFIFLGDEVTARWIEEQCSTATAPNGGVHPKN